MHSPLFLPPCCSFPGLYSLPNPRRAAAVFHGGFIFATVFSFFSWPSILRTMSGKTEIHRLRLRHPAGRYLSLFRGGPLPADGTEIRRGVQRFHERFQSQGLLFPVPEEKGRQQYLYLLVGITLTFISLTAPIQLHGHYITLFWASEWCCCTGCSRNRTYGSSSWPQAGGGYAIVSLFMDWFGVCKYISIF